MSIFMSTSVIGVNSNPKFRCMGTAGSHIRSSGACERFPTTIKAHFLPFGLAVTKLSTSSLSCFDVRRRALAFGSSLWRQAQKSRFCFGGSQRERSHVNARCIGAGLMNLSDHQILQTRVSMENTRGCFIVLQFDININEFLATQNLPATIVRRIASRAR